MSGFDTAIRRTYRSPDDTAHTRQQSRKRRKATPPEIPDGPCCLRCQHWQPPGAHDEFGVCAHLAAVERPTKFSGYVRGEVVEIDVLLRDPEIVWDRLHTTAGFRCRGFVLGARLEEPTPITSGHPEGTMTLTEQVRMPW